MQTNWNWGPDSKARLLYVIACYISVVSAVQKFYLQSCQVSASIVSIPKLPYMFSISQMYSYACTYRCSCLPAQQMWLFFLLPLLSKWGCNSWEFYIPATRTTFCKKFINKQGLGYLISKYPVLICNHQVSVRSTSFPSPSTFQLLLTLPGFTTNWAGVSVPCFLLFNKCWLFNKICFFLCQYAWNLSKESFCASSLWYVVNTLTEAIEYLNHHYSSSFPFSCSCSVSEGGLQCASVCVLNLTQMQKVLCRAELLQSLEIIFFLFSPSVILVRWGAYLLECFFSFSAVYLFCGKNTVGEKKYEISHCAERNNKKIYRIFEWYILGNS